MGIGPPGVQNACLRLTTSRRYSKAMQTCVEILILDEAHPLCEGPRFVEVEELGECSLQTF